MTTGVVLPDAPDSIAGQPLFAVHHVEFTVADVVRGARPGDREPVAPAGRAAEVQEDFRRSRGLLTSDRLIDWLAARAVSPEQFQEWSESPTDATWAAFVCSGSLERTTAEVAAAAAAACELGAAPTSATSFDPTGWTERLAARAVTPDAVASAIVQHRLGWTRIRATGALASDRAVAEELRQWVISDGLDLEIAATQAGCATFPVDGVLDELGPALRASLAGARPGEVVGPITPGGSRWAVVRVEGRLEPHVEDLAAVDRARAEIRARTVERAVLRHVTHCLR